MSGPKLAAIDAGKGPPGASTTEREELGRLQRDNERLEMERELLKSGGLLRAGEPMRFALIDVERVQYPIAVVCAALEATRSGRSAWKGRAAPARTKADEQLGVEIVAIHRRSRCSYGSPRVHADLRAKDRRVGKKRVARLMRKNGLAAQGKRRFRRTTDSNHDSPIAPNVLDQNFFQEAPNSASRSRRSVQRPARSRHHGQHGAAPAIVRIMPPQKASS